MTNPGTPASPEPPDDARGTPRTGMARMRRGPSGHAILLVLIAAAFLAFGWRDYRVPPSTPVLAPTGATEAALGTRPSYATPNTVRIGAADPVAAATAVTQLTYGATQHEDRPHAVTLVRADREADAMLAAARVTHFPVNSPVLYVEADSIPPATAAELQRLGPDGNVYDNNVQVYLVGPISERVEQEVRTRFGYRTRAFRIANPIALSETLDTWAAAVHADHPDAVAVVQYNALATGLPVVTWNAHMGDGMAFVIGDSIPPETLRMLTRRFHQESFVYLMGDSTLISNRVARVLGGYAHVQRIGGETPQAVSVNFARYRDHGMNQGRWIGFSRRDFGWSVTESGHNFTIVDPADWQLAVTGSLLSHMGKHGPMLLLSGGALPDSTAAYLASVRPESTSLDQLTFNHAWILGTLARIPWSVQVAVDTLLDQPGSATP